MGVGVTQACMQAAARRVPHAPEAGCQAVFAVRIRCRGQEVEQHLEGRLHVVAVEQLPPEPRVIEQHPSRVLSAWALSARLNISMSIVRIMSMAKYQQVYCQHDDGASCLPCQQGKASHHRSHMLALQQHNQRLVHFAWLWLCRQPRADRVWSGVHG